MSGRRIVLVLLLAAVALASGWFLNRLASKPPAQAAGEQAPDYYVENFTATTMDERGFPRRRLTAAYMAHFRDSDTHELSAPHLVLFQQAATPWHVRSERAWVSPGGEEMRLLGKVHIWRDDASGARQVDIRTEDLRVVPDSEFGETDQRAVITTQTSESRGIGMRAWLDQRRLQLLSQVHTVYERPPR